MISKKVVIGNADGLHLRPAGDFCTKAGEYQSKVMIHFRNKEFNAKSVLGVLSACVHQMDEIELVCEGPDEEKAAEELADFLEKI